MAAAAAMPTTPRPTASRARWASRAVAPVVITSSHTTMLARGHRAASRASLGPRHRIEPERFARRSPASSPAWSRTPVRSRSRGAAVTGTPSARNNAVACPVIVHVGSSPRDRTLERREGTGTSTSGPLAPPRAATAAAPASNHPSGAASASTPRSLWARTMARTRPSYDVAAYGGAKPGGAGAGQAGTASAGKVAAHSRQSTRPGRSQPTQRLPNSRSPRASESIGPAEHLDQAAATAPERPGDNPATRRTRETSRRHR